MYNTIDVDIDFTKYYNKMCKVVKDKWMIPEVNEKHLYLWHKNEPVLSMHFAQDLSHIHYKKLKLNGIRRPSEYCFLSLRYKGGDDTALENKLFFESGRIKVDKKYNSFIGTFVIDVSDYLEIPNHSALDKLIDYVISMEDDTKFIFIVNTHDKSTAERLYRRLNSGIKRIEKVYIEQLEICQYTSYAIALLHRKGIKTNKSIEKIIVNGMNRAFKSKWFAGFDSVSDYIDDLMYVFHGVVELHEITDTHFQEAMEEIGADDEVYVKSKIGFQ